MARLRTQNNITHNGLLFVQHLIVIPAPNDVRESVVTLVTEIKTGIYGTSTIRVKDQSIGGDYAKSALHSN